MAQLKDLIVSGSTRLVGDATANNIQITSIKAHSAANSTTFGPGSNGEALFSDGTAIYWGAIPATVTDATVSGWGYVKANDVATVMRYQGTKEAVTNLPTSGNTVGDVWHVNANGSEYAWDGSEWQELGTAIDLSGYALKSHTHGNITNSGDITAAAPTIANGDQLVINDNSASKITNGPTFDGSTTTTALTPKGTWETFSKFSGSYNDLTNKPTIPTLPSNIVNTITTTAGTHTEITSQKGDVSFNVPTKTSHLDNDSGFVTSSGVTSITTESPISGGTITGTGTISHAVSGVGTATTTPGFYKFKYDTYGHVTGVSSVTASDITGLVTIPTNTDEKVKSTTVTAATTNYIVGSTTSTTTTGGLSKHASAVLYTTADSGTSGYTQLRLGNTTATTSAGGKEGQIRLYGTNATYYLDLKPGAIASSNKTITFPNKTGTVALTSDIPDVSGFITTDSDEKLKIGAVANNTTNSTYYPILATNSTTAATRYYDSTGIHYNNVNGSTTAVGKADLVLGNSTASGNANNKQGTISLYSSTSNYGYFTTADLTAQRTYTFPDKTGTVALTSDIPTIPTKTSQLTNDGNGTSAFATMDDIGSFGGGTVTSITLKAGSGIALDTDNTAITTTGTRTISHSDTSSQASVSNSGRTYIQSITLDGFGHVTGLSSGTETVTNTDKQLQVAAVTSGTTYYPIVGTGTNAATRQYDTTGFIYKGTNGTTSAVGSAQLTLGNSTASGTANNKQGQLIMYGSNAKKATITLAAPSADISLALPTSGGTLALTSQLPTVPTSTGSNTTGITASTTATKTTLGTANSVIGVQSTTTTASKVTVGSHSTDYGVTAAGSGSASLTFTMDTTDTKQLNITFSHTHTAPTLGSKVPTVSASNVTVPIKNTSSTSIPNVSVTEATVSITDPGHTHTI